ncbi:MAG: helix-turn-helix domain-containing protein [Anaerolineaceae bacterium]|nr:helix-turn-helix domain-containing protein [Anaerolineaceae bacterium]
MPDEPTEILTIEEAAAYLRIPTSSVYKLAQAGKIPAQKVGRHWRFYRPSLTQWIASGQLNPDAKKNKPEKLDFT